MRERENLYRRSRCPTVAKIDRFLGHLYCLITFDNTAPLWRVAGAEWCILHNLPRVNAPSRTSPSEDSDSCVSLLTLIGIAWVEFLPSTFL